MADASTPLASKIRAVATSKAALIHAHRCWPVISDQLGFLDLSGEAHDMIFQLAIFD